MPSGFSSPRPRALLTLPAAIMWLAACTVALGQAAPEPYVASGRVVDARGNPLAGVQVFADNTAFYNFNVFAVTDEDGRYRIELGDVTPSSWRVAGYVERRYNDVRLQLPLRPSASQAFAGATGAVRDFTWLMQGETPEGDHYGVTVYLYDASCCDSYVDDTARIEVTFVPLAPLLDGSEGEIVVRYPDGTHLVDVPVTKYRVSARYVPEGSAPVAMLIKERRADDFTPTTDADFHDVWGYLGMELEVMLP